MTPRGGKRAGAGRPALHGERKRQVGIMLPPSLDDWLVAEGKACGRSRSELLAEALEAQRSGAGATHSDAGPTAEAPEVAAYLALMATLGEALAVNSNAGIAERELRLPADAWKAVETYAKGHGLHRDAAATRLIRLGAVAADHLESSNGEKK